MKVKKALRDLVLIEPDKQKEETIGGIIIPNITMEKLSTGTVLDLGSGTKDVDTSDISIGDKVLYQKNAGTEIKSGDKDCILIKYDAIFSIVED